MLYLICLDPYEIDENWSINTSIFHEMILNKKNLLFLIHKHYEINRIQGFYIEKEINKIYDSNDENFFEMKGIIDSNAFLFEIKNGKIEYY